MYTEFRKEILEVKYNTIFGMVISNVQILIN